MTDLRTAAQQALEALEDLRVWRVKQSMAITALRAALAEPVQEPQRKPLDDLAIADIYAKWDATPGASMADFARAVEQAHGVKELEHE